MDLFQNQSVMSNGTMNYSIPAGCVALPCAVGLVGNTVINIYGLEWYRKVKKSSLNPPEWAFGPIWTVLYIAMGYASYLIYEKGAGDFDTIKVPIALYAIQLALNFAWVVVFFGIHKTGWALINLLGLLASIGGCIWTFHALSHTAAHIMIPYFVWICIAGYLNYYIWRNNPATITEVKTIGEILKTKETIKPVFYSEM